MNETFEQCRKNLLRRGFEVRIAATTEEARQILREEIRAAAPETISFGGSMTMEATGIRIPCYNPISSSIRITVIRLRGKQRSIRRCVLQIRSSE